MRSDNSHAPRPEVQSHLALLHAAGGGQLDQLTCPRCQEPAMSVWFTHSGARDYFTWFTCAACGYETRAQGERPAYYVAERDRTVEPVGDTGS